MSPAFFEAEWPTIRAHLTKIGRAYLPPEFVEDAVSDTLIILLRNLHRLPEHKQGGFEFGRYCRWLFRKMMTRAWHAQQRQIPTVPYLLRGDRGKTEEHTAMLEAAEEAFYRAESQREARATLAEVMQLVPLEADRRVLLLRAIGHSNSDTARMLGVSRQLVHQRFNRAKKAISEAYEGKEKTC